MEHWSNSGNIHAIIQSSGYFCNSNHYKDNQGNDKESTMSKEYTCQHLLCRRTEIEGAIRIRQRRQDGLLEKQLKKILLHYRASRREERARGNWSNIGVVKGPGSSSTHLGKPSDFKKSWKRSKGKPIPYLHNRYYRYINFASQREKIRQHRTRQLPSVWMTPGED